jgi:hypothetical protein
MKLVRISKFKPILLALLRSIHQTSQVMGPVHVTMERVPALPPITCAQASQCMRVVRERRKKMSTLQDTIAAVRAKFPAHQVLLET